MTRITENHPKWPFYSHLRKCAEITASGDGTHFGLNCSHCPTIFTSWRDIEDFISHLQQQHADVLHTEGPQRKSKSQQEQNTKKRKLDVDLDRGAATQKRSLRSRASRSTAATSFENGYFEVANSDFVLKQEVNLESIKAEEEEGVCVVNEQVDDPLEVANSCGAVAGSHHQEVHLRSVLVKKEACMAKVLTESDSKKITNSENDVAVASNSKESAKSRSVAGELLQIAEVYERHPLLWDLDNDENHDRLRQSETLQQMWLEVKEKLNHDIPLEQLRERIKLCRRYYTVDKRKRLKCEKNRRKFVPNKPLLYEKMQFYDRFVGPYRCDKCHKEIAQYLQLQAHMAAHAGNPLHKCSVCQKEFKNFSVMITHKRRHTSEKTCVCTICGASYFREGELTAHLTIHTGEKKFICHICGAAYRTQSLLTKHKNRRHNPDRPRYPCPLCPKTFKEKVVLNGHMNTHANRRNAVCPVCGKAFYIRRTLAAHMQIHNVVKKFECDLCEKRFAQKAGLCTHRRLQHNIVKISEKKLA